MAKQRETDQQHLRELGETIETIPIVEEELKLDKREVVTGRVRVRTVVDVVEEMARASLDEETVEVTRVPVDRVVDEAPGIRTENDVTIVPILEEVLVVEKRLVLKEELHIRRRVGTEAVEVPMTLRKQRAVVERISPDDPGICRKLFGNPFSLCLRQAPEVHNVQRPPLRSLGDPALRAVVSGLRSEPAEPGGDDG
jgi:stress response protein YsnF